jgi:hypothetical protein
MVLKFLSGFITLFNRSLTYQCIGCMGHKKNGIVLGAWTKTLDPFFGGLVGKNNCLRI